MDSRNKKTNLSTSTLPEVSSFFHGLVDEYLEHEANEQDDIYNEIELEDLRGPAVDTTIRLDVQDQEDQTNDEDNTARGIIAGKSPDVSLTCLIR